MFGWLGRMFSGGLKLNDGQTGNEKHGETTFIVDPRRVPDNPIDADELAALRKEVAANPAPGNESRHMQARLLVRDDLSEAHTRFNTTRQTAVAELEADTKLKEEKTRARGLTREDARAKLDGPEGYLARQRQCKEKVPALARAANLSGFDKRPDPNGLENMIRRRNGLKPLHSGIMGIIASILSGGSGFFGILVKLVGVIVGLIFGLAMAKILGLVTYDNLVGLDAIKQANPMMWVPIALGPLAVLGIGHMVAGSTRELFRAKYDTNIPAAKRQNLYVDAMGALVFCAFCYFLQATAGSVGLFSLAKDMAQFKQLQGDLEAHALNPWVFPLVEVGMSGIFLALDWFLAKSEVMSEIENSGGHTESERLARYYRANPAIAKLLQWHHAWKATEDGIRECNKALKGSRALLKQEDLVPRMSDATAQLLSQLGTQLLKLQREVYVLTMPAIISENETVNPDLESDDDAAVLNDITKSPFDNN